VVTVFRSRLRPEALEEYEPLSERMVDLARAMPGFVDYKTFASDDGERVTLVTFASMDDHIAWRNHPEHREAQTLGRERLYDSFTIQVCQCPRETRFQH
jgi:heme-degrading monooxygenase HmoA